MTSSVRVRPLTVEDWPEFRAIRLRMLAELPIAFGETLAHAERLADVDWRARLVSYAANGAVRFVAEDPISGAWLGTMGGYLQEGAPMLVGVYVAPEARGVDAGVTDGLLAPVEEWAASYSGALRLLVHEDNVRARAAYAKRGFVEDGVVLPYPLDRSRNELRMVKALTRYA